jgi:predicted permease
MHDILLSSFYFASFSIISIKKDAKKTHTKTTAGKVKFQEKLSHREQDFSFQLKDFTDI